MNLIYVCRFSKKFVWIVYLCRKIFSIAVRTFY
uniref:Uncharacterized protein n=1 Tax=Siphoviridae sp. ctiOl67 TaxID=2825622 RepID=A0A8S5QIV0_9CAUD|nr:MAG TPA: hypothetical protein [Siphoviridae sp. ctiOl67]